MQRQVAFFFFVILSVQSNTLLAQELLWCSGSRATSPLCIEFNEALQARAQAEEMKAFLESIANPPWPDDQFVGANKLVKFPCFCTRSLNGKH